MSDPHEIVSKILVYKVAGKYTVRICCPGYSRHILFGKKKSDTCVCEIVGTNLEKSDAVELGESLSRKYFAVYELRE